MARVYRKGTGSAVKKQGKRKKRPCGGPALVPTNVYLTFDTVDKGRHDRIRARSYWDETSYADTGPASTDHYVVNLQSSDDGVTPDLDFAGANLYPNGSAESALTDSQYQWGGAGTPTWGRTKTQAHHGAWSRSLAAAGASIQAGWYDNSNVSYVSGRKYTFSCWYYATGTGCFPLFYGPGSTSPGVEIPVGVWTQYTVTFTATVTGVYETHVFEATVPAGRTVYFDDGRLSEGGTTEHYRRAVVDRKDASGDVVNEKVWHAGIRKWRYYRTRVKAVDKHGCTDGFSSWTPWARPGDTTAPPVPTSVTFDVDQHDMTVKWENDDEDWEIVTATAAASVATITTSLPNSIQVGDVVKIASMTPAGYNGVWTVLTKPSDKVFTANIGTTPGAGSAFGSVRDMGTPDENIAFTHVQVSTDSAFTEAGIIRQDRVTSEHKRFKISKPTGNYWARVRNVDSARNKSIWVTYGPVTKKTPNTPVISSITFDSLGTRHARYRALVTVTTGTTDTDAEVDRLIVQFCHKSTNVTPTASDRKHREVLDPEPDATDDLVATFRNVRKDHYTFARVRKWDTQGRKSAWSAWTSGGQPSGMGAPANPSGVVISLPSDRRIKVKWDAETAQNEEVHKYAASIYKGANPGGTWMADLYTKGHHVIYHVPAADVNTAHHSVVVAINDEMTNSSGVTTGDVTPGAPLSTPTVTSIAFDMLGTRHARYRGLVTVTTGSADTNVELDHLMVMFCHKATNVTPTSSDRKHRERIPLPTDGTDDLIATFRNIRKDHYTFARVKKVSAEGRQSAWSAWSSGGKPTGTTTPATVTGVTIANPKARKFKVRWTKFADDDEEVTLYRVRIYKGNTADFSNLVETGYTLGDVYPYDVPKADRGANHHARVNAISSEGTASADHSGLTAVADAETVGNDDLAYDEVRFDKFKISGAKAYGSTNQSVANATDEVMGVNTASFDTDSAVDLANNAITMVWSDRASKGVFMIVAHAQWAANGTGRRLIKIEKKTGGGAFTALNGAQCNIPAASTGPTDSILTHIFSDDLAAGVLKLRAVVNQTSGAALVCNGGVGTKYLSVFYIGTADGL